MPGTPRGRRDIFDDFEMDNVAASTADGVRWLSTIDTGGTGAVGPAFGTDTYKITLDTTDNDMGEIAHALLAWRVQDGELGMEVRFQVDVITDLALSFGFNDDALEDSNTLPVELSTTTFTTNSSTWVGVLFDVDATNDDFHAFWVDDDSDSTTAIATLRFTTPALVAARWFTVRIVLTDQGSGNQVRAELSIIDEETGSMSQKTFASTVDRDALLTPHVALENRATAAHVLDIDYIHVWSNRVQE